MNHFDEESLPWITDTQIKLGEIIERPQLTRRLLARPPFKFIHDIAMEVMRATGFGDTLFGDEDRNASFLSVREIK
jgi:TRAF3-interacting protein 1